MKIGIDLGTSTTIVSRLDLYGKPQILLRQSGNNFPFIPSVVHISLDKNIAYVGQEALELLEINPSIKLIQFFKRQFGKNNPLLISKDGDKWYPEGITALLLKKILNDIELKEDRIEGAVITVPAHFDEEQKQTVLDAANLINLPVLALIEEPIAAAYHHSLLNPNSEKEFVLVYDLGGGTFDITVLNVEKGKVDVIAKGGLQDLGGKEFDELVAQMIIKQFTEYTDLGRENIELTAIETIKLRNISEYFKKVLSQSAKDFYTKTVKLKGISLDVTLRKEDLITVFTPLIQRTIDICKGCLTSIDLAPKQINTVLIVGGGGLTLGVKKQVEDLFKLENQKVIFHEPLKSISYGAAIFADKIKSLSQNRMTYSKIAEYNYGVKTYDLNTKKVEMLTIIKKNSPIPIKASQVFYKNNDEQNFLYFEVSRFRDQYLRIEDSNIEVIGKYKMEEIKSNEPITLKMQLQENGLLSVQAFISKNPIKGELEISVRGKVKDYLKHQKDLLQSIILGSHNS